MGYGSNYPPGAENDPRAPWNQVNMPCEVCGQNEDDCVCPECSVCGDVGSADCYTLHGMQMTDEQIIARSEAEERERILHEIDEAMFAEAMDRYEEEESERKRLEDMASEDISISEDTHDYSNGTKGAEFE